MRRFTSMGCSCTSKPATVAVPAVGGRKHVRTRIVVVFPAPLGPRKPTICPFSTSKEMLSTATVRAYRLVRPSTLIIWLVPGKQCKPLEKETYQLAFGHESTTSGGCSLRIRLETSSYGRGEVLSNEAARAIS